MNTDARRHLAQSLRAAAMTLASTPYDPDNAEHRKEFADKLKGRLESSGFKLAEKRSRGEEDAYVFTHRKDPGLSIKVLTSSAGGQMREKGADAIRVLMLYTQQRHGEKKTIPIVPPTPASMKARGKDGKMGWVSIIKRMPGTPIDKLVDRVIERARYAYKIVNELERCSSCSAPMAFKKMTNKDPVKRYCAELCWTNKKSGSTLKASIPLPPGTTEEQQITALEALADRYGKRRDANDAVSYAAKVLAKKWPPLVRGAKAFAIAEWARGFAKLR
jgi:hypothetical protein